MNRSVVVNYRIGVELLVGMIELAHLCGLEVIKGEASVISQAFEGAF